MKNLHNNPERSYIGVFDSGYGGLSILKAIVALMPDVNTIYFADQANVPYGSRTLLEIQVLAEAITEFLINSGAKLIVVACNTASAAALSHLRQIFPDHMFVGMEPAVKPAVEISRTGKVGVLATPATFQGNLYNSLVERYGNNVEIFQDTCPGLVKEIEAGRLNCDRTEGILRKAISPMISKGVDTIVLGCTHYPFTIPLINKITNNEVKVIDPSPAVARQTKRIFDQLALGELSIADRDNIFITSGNPHLFKTHLSTFILNENYVYKAVWHNKKLVIEKNSG